RRVEGSAPLLRLRLRGDDPQHRRPGEEGRDQSLLETGQRGLRPEHFEAAIAEEFSEHEDLPNTTNPDEWARISGRKGERVTHLRMMHLDTTRGAPVVPHETEISEVRPNSDLV